MARHVAPTSAPMRLVALALCLGLARAEAASSRVIGSRVGERRELAHYLPSTLRPLTLRGGESVAPTDDTPEAPPPSAEAQLDAAGIKEYAVRLVTWENPALSAGVFAAGNLLFWLLLVQKWSPISLASWVLFLAIVAGVLYTTFAKFLVGFLGPAVVRSPKLGVAYAQPSQLLPLIAPVCDFVNFAIDDVKRACWCVSYAHTAKYLVCSWLLSKLSRHVSLGVMAYLALLGAFGLPKLVEANREEINEALSLATQQLSGLKSQLSSEVTSRLSSLKVKQTKMLK